MSAIQSAGLSVEHCHCKLSPAGRRAACLGGAEAGITSRSMAAGVGIEAAAAVAEALATEVGRKIFSRRTVVGFSFQVLIPINTDVSSLQGR